MAKATGQVHKIISRHRAAGITNKNIEPVAPGVCRRQERYVHGLLSRTPPDRKPEPRLHTELRPPEFCGESQAVCHCRLCALQRDRNDGLVADEALEKKSRCGIQRIRASSP